MLLFRIAAGAFVRDLSGAGARLAGGRWNPRGLPAVYASRSRALAALEVLAHVPVAFLPLDMSLVELLVPDELEIEVLESSALPEDWRICPPGVGTQEVGAAWLRSGRSLLLEVPSVLVPQEMNVLLNPLHRDMARVQVAGVEAFAFDARLGQ
jgi:RES domain-containing protein